MMRVRVFLVLLVFVAGAAQAQMSQEQMQWCSAQISDFNARVSTSSNSPEGIRRAKCFNQVNIYTHPSCNYHPDAKRFVAEGRACLDGGSPDSGRKGTAVPSAPVRKPSTKRKPRSHVPEAMAHHCLKPQFKAGGGVVNDCPFSVEYSYCVERPTKGSWSEQFECGKGGGSWQVGPGPGKKSIMHTAGAKVLWFACKYRSPGAAKPDGVSPKDVKYVPGRGLEGRCAEWGAK